MEQAEESIDVVAEAGERALNVADGAVQALADAVEQRRRQAEMTIAVLADLRGQRADLTAELQRTREELRRSNEEHAALRRQHLSLASNHRRLYAGFTRLMKAVEEAHGIQLGVDQRVEAALLASDIGVDLGDALDVTPRRIESLVSDQAA